MAKRSVRKTVRRKTGEAGSARRGMELKDVIEITMLANSMEDEMLGRYVSNPSNLGKIRERVQQFFERMEELAASRPVDCGEWVHRRCKCLPPNHFGGRY